MITKMDIYCPKCKQENLINVRQQQIIVIEPTLKRRADNTKNGHFLGLSAYFIEFECCEKKIHFLYF